MSTADVPEGPSTGIFEAYYRTYNSEDPEALAGFYADDVVMVSAAGESHGVDAILDTYRYLIANFHDQMTPESIAIDGDTGVVRIVDHFRAKQPVEEFFGRRFAPGDEMTLCLVGTYTVRDGRFSRVEIRLVE